MDKEKMGIEFVNASLGEAGIESLNISGKNHDFNAPIKVVLAGLHTASLYFDWSQQTIGFGQASISVQDGVVSANTEGMSREWMRRACYAAVDVMIDALPVKAKADKDNNHG